MRERPRPFVSPGLPRGDSPRTRYRLEIAGGWGGRTCTHRIEIEGGANGKEVTAGRAVRDAARPRAAQAGGALDRGRDGPQSEGREEGDQRPAGAGARDRGPRHRRAGEAQGGCQEGREHAQEERQQAQCGGEEGGEDAGEGGGLDREPGADRGSPGPESRLQAGGGGGPYRP